MITLIFIYLLRIYRWISSLKNEIENSFRFS